MRLRHVLILLAVFLAGVVLLVMSGHVNAAGTFRCDYGTLVHSGDSILAVEQRCGEPVRRTNTGTREALMYRHPWTGRLWILHFRNARIYKIEDIGN